MFRGIEMEPTFRPEKKAETAESTRKKRKKRKNEKDHVSTRGPGRSHRILHRRRPLASIASGSAGAYFFCLELKKEKAKTQTVQMLTASWGRRQTETRRARHVLKRRLLTSVERNADADCKRAESCA